MLYVLTLTWDDDEQWMACGVDEQEAAGTLKEAFVRFTSREMRHAGRPGGAPAVQVLKDDAAVWWMTLGWPDEVNEHYELQLLVLRPGTCTRDGRTM